MINCKDIYEVKVYFEDNPKKYKVRPVVVMNVLDINTCTITEITSIAPSHPPKYYDQFKEPILKWREVGLDKKSYAKVHKTYNINTSSLYKYIGVMDDIDFIKIYNRIIELI